MFVPVVEPVLDLFKIHRKMIFGNPPIIVKNMLRKTPESLNAVNVVFRLLVDHAFRVIDGKMLPQPLQGVVAFERIGVVDRALSRFLPDDRHKVIRRDPLDYPRIYPPVTLQKAENDAFTLGSSSALPFPSASEVRLVHLNVTRKFRSLKFCGMIQCKAKFLVDASYRLIVRAQIICQAICRLLLVESGDDADLRTDHLQALLLAAQSAFDVPSGGSIHPERTAPNALFSPQKVGRAPENVLSSCNHKGILPPRGYETH